VEDLLDSLVKAGEEVAYLNVGAKSTWPFTRLRERSGLPCRAWNLSSKLAFTEYWMGTINPLSQILPDRAYRRRFLTVIEQNKPDLVHIHELTSFPIELLTELRRRSIRTVFSAADFYVLCPTVKLFRPDHSFCEKTTDQLDCYACSISARSERAKQWEYANDHWLGGFVKARNLGRRLIRTLERFFCKPAPPRDYIERRHHFERIFREVDVVLTTSMAQRRIFEQRTNGWHIRYLQRARSTIRIDFPAPRLSTRSPGKLVFVALNIVNPAKGLLLLEKTFAALHKDHPEVELHIYGMTDGKAPGIRYFGPYDDQQLDEIIGAADFGILPSIWPEAFGYVGPEMLSRGLPVLASNRGAMPDYVMEGVNGMLFDPATPEALENCLRALANDASLRRKLWKGAACSERHYLSMDVHTAKLRSIYRQTMGHEPVESAIDSKA
jgi:glycosyltransferase involved in cell wall biosynthesis